MNRSSDNTVNSFIQFKNLFNLTEHFVFKYSTSAIERLKEKVNYQKAKSPIHKCRIPVCWQNIT